MREFPSSPTLKTEVPGLYWLSHDYVYEWEHEGVRYRLTAEHGTQTDLASVPRPVWPVIAPHDLGYGPPLFHDLIYRSGGDVNANPFGRSEKLTRIGWVETDPWTRRNADRLFCRLMRELEISKWRRRSAYIGVRVGGFFAWQSSP